MSAPRFKLGLGSRSSCKTNVWIGLSTTILPYKTYNKEASEELELDKMAEDLIKEIKYFFSNKERVKSLIRSMKPQEHYDAWVDDIENYFKGK